MKREFKRRIKIQRKGEVNKEKDLTIIHPFQRQGKLERKKQIHPFQRRKRLEKKGKKSSKVGL